MIPPRWRVCLAPVSRACRVRRVRVSIGGRFRDFPAADARAVADRIHDVCDRIETQERDRER